MGTSDGGATALEWIIKISRKEFGLKLIKFTNKVKFESSVNTELELDNYA